MRLHSFICAAAIFAAASSPVSAAPFSALYVFGDSLSDNGNLSALGASLGISVPNAPYATGRATNGSTAVEVLAQQLGLSVTPWLAPGGGNNYAVIGAATGPVPAPSGPDNVIATYGITLPVPTGIVNAQVPLFLSSLAGQSIDADALFFIWGGSNDLFISPTQGTAVAAAANIQATISTLHGFGARRFFVPNLPGLVPFASDFNTALASGLAAAPGLLAGIDVIQFDTFAYFNRVLLNPTAFGFSNVASPCYQGPPLAVFPGGQACVNPDQYLLWDDVHPTAAAHRQLGQAFAIAVAPVPEPMTLALAGVGIAVVALRRRRAA